jgi:hypothetical protein
MSNTLQPRPISEHEYEEAKKRVKKIKGFYHNLANWAGVSVLLLAINLFTSGDISWAKYPIFFWGISIVMQAFRTMRLQRLDKQWEENQMRKFTGDGVYPTSESTTTQMPQSATNQVPQEHLEDYTEELLNRQEREFANLSEYRKLKRPWKDEDLV